MANRQSRKYLLTIQNPLARGFSHEMIKEIIASMNITYWCMADEKATTGTLHTHLFLYRKGALRESTIRRKFPGVHFDSCIGTCTENREYVSKSGKWAEDEKADTSIPGTFEEFGEMPSEKMEKIGGTMDIIESIEEGKTTANIIRENPEYLFKSNEIDTLRETLKSEKYLAENREVEVIYIYGPTGTGKTRSIFENYPATDICRITNYNNGKGVRFDAYHGQSVLVFEEFHSQIDIGDMLNYLDRYPLMLPARYSDRVACYTTVYITSNVALERQYALVSSETRDAFLRRITKVIEFQTDGSKIVSSIKEKN